MQHTISAIIHKGESLYIGECLGVSIVTQGRTLDETVRNLQEAVSVHLEGEDLADLQVVPDPALIVALELDDGHTFRLLGTFPTKR